MRRWFQIFFFRRRIHPATAIAILRGIWSGVDVECVLNTQITQKTADMRADGATAQDARYDGKWKYTAFH